jgi:hypothetical protein
MGRIQNAYETKLRTLLGQLKARRPEQGVRWLLERAQELSRQESISHPHALAQVYERTRQRVEKWLRRSSPPAQAAPPRVTAGPARFLCDAGLGGLARWLRAAGYEAHWLPNIDDDDLLREARRLAVTLLTTDSMLMERRLLRDGHIPALWISPALTKRQQLGLVLSELGLGMREPRCMSCGGRLRPMDKESLRERIPPRTYRWLDEYFVCDDCGKLFWHGTHWQRIRAQLEKLRRPDAPPHHSGTE